MRWGMALFYLFMWHMQPTMRIARRCAVLPLPRTLLPPHALPLGQTDRQTDGRTDGHGTDMLTASIVSK